MAAPTPLRRLAVALLLASAPAGAVTPVAAVDVIPAEQGGERLPEATVTAVVGDVDGDGVRELIRLGPLPDNPTLVGVEVISADGEGRLTRYSMAPFRRLAGVEEQTEGQAVPDERGFVAARIDEPARLLVWRLAGAERVLVAAIGTRDNPRACCLTLGEVIIGDDGHTAIVERAAIPDSASWIRAADLDADGTDEIVVAEPPAADAPERTLIYVLRWSGRRFVRLEGAVAVPADAEGAGELLSFGDSDGLPGEEVGMATDDGTVFGRTLNRISLDADGDLRVEQARLRFAGPLVPVDFGDGGRLLIGLGSTALLAWPAGSDAVTLEGEAQRRGFPVAALGSGTRARVLLMLNDQLEVLDSGLRAVGTTLRSSATDASTGGGRFPYLGRLPGGLDGGDAFVFGGTLLVGPPASQPDAAVRELPVASLASTTPIGTFGPDGLLVGLAEGQFFDATREGGQLLAQAGELPGVALTAPPTSAALSTEADGGRLQPALSGAVLVERGPATPLLLTRSGFTVTVEGPAGTRVIVFEDELDRDPMLMPEAGTLDVNVPARSPQFRVRLLVITPSGHAYVANWAVRVADAPPPLEVALAEGGFGLSVPVAGRTAPDAIVTVDGTEVPVDAEGAFAMDVGAWPIPHEVVVRAADALGNEASRTLSIVAPFDYRRLPWIPIVVAFTIIAGAVLYIRAPRPSPTLSRPAGDDAVLEEIE